MQSRYTVSLKKVGGSYSVWVPGLPGCASQGETETEALDNIRDAIREYSNVATVNPLCGEVAGILRENEHK